MITEKDAIDLIMLAEELEINVFIDGGWGVDALLGEQTREHQDIDLFVEERQAVRFIHALHQQGFKERTETYSTPQHIVFADADGRTVDLHLFTYTSSNLSGGHVQWRRLYRQKESVVYSSPGTGRFPHRICF